VCIANIPLILLHRKQRPQCCRLLATPTNCRLGYDPLHWSYLSLKLIELLAYQAKGLPPMATTLAVERRYATSTCHAFPTLDEYSNQGSCMLAAAIASETVLITTIHHETKFSKLVTSLPSCTKQQSCTFGGTCCPACNLDCSCLTPSQAQCFVSPAAKQYRLIISWLSFFLLYMSPPKPCIAFV
jgi:hypothetical protein